jgi:lipopolysaccharide transport system permease protein
MQDTNKKTYYEITAPKYFSIGLLELWQYRELFYMLAWRDIKIKYKQTILGMAWAILQPVIMMFIFTFFFGKTLRIPSENMPYPIFILSGLLIWNLFSSGINTSASAMVSNAGIIKKIYFPRLIIPFSAIAVSLFDFLISVFLFAVLIIYYNIPISISNFCICFISSIAIALLTTVGLGSMLAALTVKYRDFKFILPFLIQLLLFVSPVIYPLSIIKNDLVRYIIYLNPISLSVELMHSAVNNTMPQAELFLCGSAISIMVFVTGIIYFRKTEYYFADIA